MIRLKLSIVKYRCDNGRKKYISCFECVIKKIYKLDTNE